MPLPDLKDIVNQLDQGRIDEALAALDALVDRAPGYAAAHVVRARALEAADRWQDAFRGWQEAGFLAPDSPTVQAGLWRTLTVLAGGRPGRRPPSRPSAPAPAGPQSSPYTERGPVPEPARPEAATSVAEPEPEPEPIQPPDFEDLDRLIAELESARIVPDPNLDAMPTPDLENDIEDMVSETLARIYAAQNQFEEAARVYEQLAAQEPERATEYLHKATEMRKKA